MAIKWGLHVSIACTHIFHSANRLVWWRIFYIGRHTEHRGDNYDNIDNSLVKKTKIYKIGFEDLPVSFFHFCYRFSHFNFKLWVLNFLLLLLLQSLIFLLTNRLTARHIRYNLLDRLNNIYTSVISSDFPYFWCSERFYW